MAKKHNMTPEEAERLFSQVDASGVLDPAWERQRESSSKRRAKLRSVSERTIDPLSGQDPSGSQVSKTISRTAIFVIVGVFALVLGMQIAYGVSRRLSTANLSDRANVETVAHAMESGVEWGDGFTQFPREFTVDEASEKTGTVEVSVVDTSSANELEILSNSQIQASALATNALLNEKINRVVYNVYALVDEDGAIQHDRFFSLIPASGTRRAMLTFIWTKSQSDTPSNIDWELKIIGMDDDLAEAIQEQVNSVSSLTEDPGVSQSELDEEQRLIEQDMRLATEPAQDEAEGASDE